MIIIIIIRGNAKSLEIFKAITLLGNADIEFNTMDSDLTKSLIYGEDTDKNRLVSSEAGLYWHNELYPDNYENMIHDNNNQDYYI